MWTKEKRRESTTTIRISRKAKEELDKIRNGISYTKLFVELCRQINTNEINFVDTATENKNEIQMDQS